MKNMKNIKLITLFVLVLLILTACGTPDDANKLLRYAKRQYGDCTIVSKVDKEDGGVKLIVRDSLQGFEYHLYSGMQDITIDGSKFGSTPYKSDDFKEKMCLFIVSEVKGELDNLCTSGRKYKFDDYYESMDLYVYSYNEEDTIEFAKECATILQNHNKKHRLDDYTVYAKVSDYSKEYYGRYLLPKVEWQSIEDERIEVMYDYAIRNIDAGSHYIRKETVPFSQTGADIKNVLEDYYDDYFNPVYYEESMVDCYYFRSSLGKEYYVCNFVYYFENSENVGNELYTNY
ncbi:MAG: hypothetical protein IKR04_05595 [Clostridia bacterium]|nr:hypothetical protein [Clostridia bacterium]